MHCRTSVVVLLAVTFLSACASGEKPSVTTGQADVDYDLLLRLPQRPVSFATEVHPILERRCVVCHGCFDAPCQLKLSSFEGLSRGANPEKVYNGARISATAPTRLFIDAKNSAQWRERGFHPVIRDTPGSSEENLRDSVMYQLLRLKQENPQARVGMLSDDFTLELNRKQECPNRESVRDFARQHPKWGMPYAMPNLSDDEYRTLVQWLAQGAPPPAARQPSPQAEHQIRQWEAFFNDPSPKRRLVSRYLYEHLFLAHLHFAGSPTREFYRLVRSTTPSGEPIDEIPSLRPYDDPGRQPFYYRLRLYTPSIVAKDHVVYELSERRMARFRELFLAPDYEVSSLPSYAPESATNPFKTFRDIPPESRYRFLLDDARFFIEGFIKGPVCRGQIALNVIEDHFWVFFVNPDQPLLSKDPAFLDAVADLMQMPSEQAGNRRLWSIWTDYWKRQQDYMQIQGAYFSSLGKLSLEEGLAYVWDGDGNPNAALTIFRHFDSASVRTGLSGDYPETAWIIDYPLFERIHYLLVAGFNVYGNLTHQLHTRLFMDFLRMEGENRFLALLPVEQRRAIRDSWYVGIRANMQKVLDIPQAWLDVDAVTGYRSADPQRELYQRLEQRLGKRMAIRDPINRCPDETCLSAVGNRSELHADRAMRAITAIRGERLEVFPDLALVRVSREETGEPPLVYTLIRNKAYTNISSIFENEDRRDRSHDTLTVIKGVEGSYPNFFFDVKLAGIDRFSARYAAIRDRDDYERFVGLYGLRRTNPRFWSVADWFQERYRAEQPLRAGILDLNRYHNR